MTKLLSLTWYKIISNKTHFSFRSNHAMGYKLCHLNSATKLHIYNFHLFKTPVNDYLPLI